jgi:hypothetical protein
LFKFENFTYFNFFFIIWIKIFQFLFTLENYSYFELVHIYIICIYFVHIWKCSYMRIVQIWKLFVFRICSYMKNIHIWNLFIFWILKIVHILTFENYSYFLILFLVWKLFIFHFFKLKNCLYFKFCFNLEKKVNLMGRGPTRHPMRAGYADTHFRAANERCIGSPYANQVGRYPAPHTLVRVWVGLVGSCYKYLLLIFLFLFFFFDFFFYNISINAQISKICSKFV